MTDNRVFTGSSRRSFLKTAGAAAAGAGMLPFLRSLPAAEAGPGDTLVVVTGDTINSLDLHRTGTNRESYQVAVNCYDRLVSFGTKTMPDGSLSYDYATIVPELAESWEITDTAITFRLKKNATFQDGSKVTAEDVRWSFARAVSVGGFATVQMKAGLLEKPEQFEAVDETTFRVKLLRPSKLTLPDLAVPVPFVINSKLAKANATAADPWALDYLHKNTIGSGAYKVTRWDPGQQLVYERFDAWAGGPLPGLKRVIIREVPNTSNRRALLERGDVQVSFDLPNKDAAELTGAKNISVYSTPVENCINVVGLNYNFAPFKDGNVRKAVAWSIPYADIFQTAAYGRGGRMWGGGDKIDSLDWPRPFPYDTDIDKAKEHLAKSGFAGGFEVPLSINLGAAAWMEPTALLIQENLAKIGIKATIEKIPGASWRTASLVEKKLPLHLETFGGWLNYPCYYFYWAYKKGHLFNSSNYGNPEVETLVDQTLDMPTTDPEYAPKIKRLFEIAIEDLPRIPLWQPTLNVAVNGAAGYEYWFHRQIDARGMSRS